ncbi:MAG: DHHA1 domain-containing protein, partial [Oscillospiraceae bacterium]|nr:DHHA1 domain-containing protein [Oscillospiraceae bacterium]
LRLITVRLSVDSDYLNDLRDAYKERADDGLVAVVCSEYEGKIAFMAICGKDAIAEGIKAGDIIKHVTSISGGSGGGRPDVAMGGGKDANRIDEALAGVKSFIAGKTGIEFVVTEMGG